MIQMFEACWIVFKTEKTNICKYTKQQFCAASEKPVLHDETFKRGIQGHGQSEWYPGCHLLFSRSPIWSPIHATKNILNYPSKVSQKYRPSLIGWFGHFHLRIHECLTTPRNLFSFTVVIASCCLLVASTSFLWLEATIILILLKLRCSNQD